MSVSAVSSPAESTTSDKSSSVISLNPIGQMNELLAKEKLNEAVYVFSEVFIGTFTEFCCTVSAKGLSAKGLWLTLCALQKLDNVLHYDKCVGGTCFVS